MKRIVIFFFAFFALTCASFAQNDFRGNRPSRERMDPAEMVKRRTQMMVEQYGLTQEQAAAEREWYEGLCRMMREEGKEEKGHVQVILGTIMLMADRHAELLQDPKQPFYSAAYYKALPYIVELRACSGAQEKNEIENCLDALYGATVLKMQGRELSDDTRKALQPITHLLEMLSTLYITKTKTKTI